MLLDRTPNYQNRSNLASSAIGSKLVASGEIDEKGPPPAVPQPNTLWADKVIIINGVAHTFHFGAGNPKELEIKPEDMEKYMSSKLSDGSFPDGYITPRAEFALKEFLDNPSLPYFIRKCYSEILWKSSPDTQDSAGYPKNIDLESLLFVSPVTGRKEFREQEVLTMLVAFDRLANPIIYPDAWKSCLSQAEMEQHLLQLQTQLSDAVGAYHSGK